MNRYEMLTKLQDLLIKAACEENDDALCKVYDALTEEEMYAAKGHFYKYDD